MKLTRERLRQIIKEELEEVYGGRYGFGGGRGDRYSRSREINVGLGREEPGPPPEKKVLSPELKVLIKKLRDIKDPESKSGFPLPSAWALSSALAGNESAKKQFGPNPLNMPGYYKLEDVMKKVGLSEEEKELIRQNLK